MLISENVELAPFSTLRVGGSARYFVEAGSEEEVAAAAVWAKERNVPLYVLGGGSNLLISDSGVDGLVLRPKLRKISVRGDGETTVTAGAGEPWDEFVRFTVERNLQGLECLSGIPGELGATPIQNVGAYGQDVSQTICSVRALDRETLSVVEFENRDCQFSYRDSFFKSVARNRYIVLDVSFRLREAAAPLIAYPELEKQLAARGLVKPSLQEVRNVVIELRRSKSMVLDPQDPNGRSCGSFFVNPIVSAAEADRVMERVAPDPMPRFEQADGRAKLAAAWLIERAGFRRGTRSGSVGLSTRHALAIVCHEGARAADVADFARRIQERVLEAFDIPLHAEPVFWGFV